LPGERNVARLLAGYDSRSQLRAHLPANLLHFLAKLWPWTLIAFFLWIPAELALGHFCNAFMLERGSLILLLTFGLALLTVITALAHGVHQE
jgi:hypothetical protein